jgi:S1-C subfamily serine protease
MSFRVAPPKAAGVKPKNHVVAINGQEIHSLADLHLALFDKRVGDIVGVQVQRKAASSRCSN